MERQVESHSSVLATRETPSGKGSPSIIKRMKTSLGRKRIAPVTQSSYSLLDLPASMQQQPLVSAGEDAPRARTSLEIEIVESESHSLYNVSTSSRQPEQRPSIIESLHQTAIVISTSVVLCVLHVLLGDWTIMMPSCACGVR